MPAHPLPVTLQQECRKAQSIFTAFADPNNGLDNIIPPSVLRRAKGFAFITVVKAGFVFSARAGSGIVIARLKDGTWSAPSAVGTAGGGVGFQVGVELAEFLIILNSRAAVKSFMAKGSITVGGNMSVAAGPLGRNLEGTGTLSSKGSLAAMYSYSRTKGLFGGASVEGSIIVERSDANSKAYGYNVTAAQLLSGAVETPEWAAGLVDTLARRSGRDARIPGWIEDGEEVDRGYGRAADWDDSDIDDDDDSRDDRERGGRGRRDVHRDDGLTPREYEERGYAFGSQFASGGSGKDKTGGGGGKFSGMLGSVGRSKSKNGSLNGGPVSGGEARFDTQFEDEFDFSPTSRSRTDAEDPFSDNLPSSPGLGRSSASPPSSKLIKRRSSSLLGTSSGNGLRDRVGAMKWSSSSPSSRTPYADDADRPRNSFDSLDDPEPNSSYAYDQDWRDESPAKKKGLRGRFRSSTVTAESYSSRHDVDDDDGPVGGAFDRGALSRSSSKKSKPATTRNRSFSSPFSRKPSSKSSAATAFGDDDDSLSHVRSNDSSTSDWSSLHHGSATSSRRPQGRRAESAGPRPWDSEDDEFTRQMPPSRSAAARSTSYTGSTGAGNGNGGGRAGGRDAFDFSLVEADFASATTNGHGANGGGRQRASTLVPSSTGAVAGRGAGAGRTRSGTVTNGTGAGTGGKGLGIAIALFNFDGVEPTDLPFRKNDTITLLNRDDDEWYKGRIGLREGMVPRNYLEVHWH
ncbi:hypothetical protein JCM1840_006099 [Sporobolomyces johnsonii]